MLHVKSVCMVSCFSRVQFCATLWIIACHAPLSMGFPRQKYWSGLPFPSPGDLPGIEPIFLRSPALAVRLAPPGKEYAVVRGRDYVLYCGGGGSVAKSCPTL